MKKLPLGTSSFRKLISSNELYVDKTSEIYKLINFSTYQFLSRPRRFGKSLLVSTLEAIFSGDKELFENLDIYKTDYKWDKYPIINLDFSKIDSSSHEEFTQSLIHALNKIRIKYGVNESSSANVIDILNDLIFELSKSSKIVILIDEYDSPILNNINKVEEREKITEILRLFYSSIKGSDEYIHKFFMTGITKVAQTSLFSGSNQVSDISSLEEFQTILGYTEQELEFYFHEYINQTSELLDISYEKLKENIKFWYNGYNFSESIKKVYNPFSILNFFAKAHSKKSSPYQNYWIRSRTSNYLYTIAKSNIYRLAEMANQLINNKFLEVKQDSLESFLPANIPLDTILFQTGYLTISKYDSDKDLYYLGYPNNEVKVALEQYLLESLFDLPLVTVDKSAIKVKYSLETNNLPMFFREIEVLLADIPYYLQQAKNRVSNYEEYYHALLQIILRLSNIRYKSEDPTNIGRSDLTIETNKNIFILELKVDDSAEYALHQIELNKYYQKYLSHNKDIILVGVKFDKNSKEISWVSKALNN